MTHENSPKFNVPKRNIEYLESYYLESICRRVQYSYEDMKPSGSLFLHEHLIIDALFATRNIKQSITPNAIIFF